MSVSEPHTESGGGRGPARRAVVAGGTLAGLGAAAGWTSPATAAPRADGTAPAEAVLRSGDLRVVVDRRFPRIVRYRYRGADLHGQPDPVDSVLIDGAAHTPTVSTEGPRGDRITYTLTFGSTKTHIDVEIRAERDRAHWCVTRIADTAALRVGTLELPDLALLTVRQDQPGAAVLTARLDLDKDGDGDTLLTLADGPPADEERAGAAYAVAWTDTLGAALEANTSYDTPADTEGASWENGRIWRRTLRSGSVSEVRLAVGQFTHRARTAPTGATEPLPRATVILTGDRNDDGRVDWQDAAIALREILPVPLGADEQHLRVVPHIPYNFASQATSPFLATLDEVKRIHLATDGLRQYALLKGYQSEGHDSAHPDYAGNTGRRAGGLADLNTLLREGRKWNADFGVHVNATESYPVANAFSDELVDAGDPQWDWLDQSYRIDPRRDLVSGDIIRRFADLRKETDAGLNTLYIDVFRESGWNSDRLQRALRDQGWHITTEWGHGLERSALWSHWATETDYGPDTSRGLNSRLIRFTTGHYRDVFADKWPTLLGVPRTGTYSGWQGKTDWHAFAQLIWTDSLPAKYLQAYPVKTWEEHEITFFGPTATTVTDAGGTRRITTDGRLVLDGGRYLLPWEPRNATDPDRLYHFNTGGGRSSWELPRGWRGARTVHVHRLTPTGRADGRRVPVRDGRVTLTAEPGRPYVVRRDPAPRPRDPGWGAGTPLTNPGFHAGTTHGWHVTGTARVEANDRGDDELVLPAGGAASVRQRLTRLRPGDWIALAHVEVGEKAGQTRRAALRVRTADGVEAVNHCDRSTHRNDVAADRKHGTRAQRIHTRFTVPEGGGPVTLTLSADAGDARVRFDNVRIVPADPRDVPGWGVFVKGDAGGATDPRTHVAQRHHPYTQRGWNGKVIDDVIDGEESLKSRGENTGLVYRTLAHTVRFTPGRRYRVTFRYQCEKAGQYAWVTGVDEPDARETDRTALPAAHHVATHTYEFTAPQDGDAWVGLRKTGDDGTAEFVLDGFRTEEV